MVGPFIFFDQIGPGEFLTGTGLDVRPYPHIGLSTVTYLFEGEIMHCDTLGVEQSIAPGALNWVTAGSGIAHSERRDAAARDRKRTLFGIQSWAAPPKDQEEIAPAFAHHAAETLPFAEEEGLRLRLIARDGWGLRSPVSGAWPCFYADAILALGARVPMPEQHEERAAYIVAGSVSVARVWFEAGRKLLLRA